LLPHVPLVLNVLNALDHGNAFGWACNALDHHSILVRIIQD
jgi:hypothetical protein